MVIMKETFVLYFTVSVAQNVVVSGNIPRNNVNHY